MAKKQIIFIAGILTSKFSLKLWKSVLKEKYPDRDIFCIGEHYSYWNIKRMKKVTKQGMNLVGNKKETILIGHSFGGIIIGSILNRTKNHRVKEIITIASPHKMNYCGMKRRKQVLKYSDKIPKGIKAKTFGAYFDPVVPFFLSSLKNSKHKNLFLEHLIFILFSKKTMKKILEY